MLIKANSSTNWTHLQSKGTNAILKFNWQPSQSTATDNPEWIDIIFMQIQVKTICIQPCWLMMSQFRLKLYWSQRWTKLKMSQINTVVWFGQKCSWLDNLNFSHFPDGWRTGCVLQEHLTHLWWWENGKQPHLSWPLNMKTLILLHQSQCWVALSLEAGPVLLPRHYSTPPLCPFWRGNHESSRRRWCQQ